MYPYGHTTDLPPTYDELVSFIAFELDAISSYKFHAHFALQNQYALEAVAALEAVGGTVYEVGSVANILCK
jgi:hypothetical protein